MKFIIFFSVAIFSINLIDAQSLIAEKLIEIGSKQLKKGLKEAHDQLKVHNAELIEKAFLDAKDCRWKLSRILKHFGTNPEHEGMPFVDFIESMKDSSKANVAEMEKMMDNELQAQIADAALDAYSNQLEELMKRSMSRYTSRLEKAKMSCIMNQIKIGMEETKVEMEELRERFKKESENSFEAQMEKYLQKMNMIEAAITTKYEACYNTEGFELCLSSFIENEKVQKLPMILKATMERLVELFMDGLRQVGPDIDHIEEVMSKYDANIEEHLKQCDI